VNIFYKYSILPVVILSLIHPLYVHASTEQFATFELSLHENELSLLLDGQITFNFSKAALEALANGLPIGVETQVRVRPVDKWYWPRPVASLTYKQEIQYHALSQHYLVRTIGYDYPRAFLTQSSALAGLGLIDDLVLVDLARLDPDEQYEVRVRTILDSESLPVPLRPLTYLSDEWRLRSEWKRLEWPEKR
jgi:hypothetical protein